MIQSTLADDHIHDKKNDEQNGARTESFSQEFFSVEFQSGHFKLQIFLQTNIDRQITANIHRKARQKETARQPDLHNMTGNHDDPFPIFYTLNRL